MEAQLFFGANEYRFAGNARRTTTTRALITVPATGHRRVDKRSAVHQRRRGIRWTALALVHPTAGTMIKALAAFLLHMREADLSYYYARVVDSIRLIAPFFDDFLLIPEEKGAETLVRLQWQQQGSRFPFQPWHLSDGTLRFICLATALLQPHPPSTLIVDEPERGQHPVAIEALAALLHEAALRTQLVVLHPVAAPAGSLRSGALGDRGAARRGIGVPSPGGRTPGAVARRIQPR